MKKTRIVMLTALLLVGVMLLSSCGIGGDSLKLKTLFDGATYVDDSPAQFKYVSTFETRF